MIISLKMVLESHAVMLFILFLLLLVVPFQVLHSLVSLQKKKEKKSNASLQSPLTVRLSITP